jgi:hypothetical protein
MTQREEQAYTIPKDHREHLLSMANGVAQMDGLSSSHPWCEYFFKIYNRYMCRGCNDTSDCWRCRSKVLSRIRELIKTYQTYGVEPSTSE